MILGSVYFNYFSNSNQLSLQENKKETKQENKKETKQENEKETKQENEKETKQENEKESKNENKSNSEKKIEKKSNLNEKDVQDKLPEEENLNFEPKTEGEKIEKKDKQKKPIIKNLVKEVEYLTTDKKGNKYKILAKSGRTNKDDKNVLDLDNVKGFITSTKRSNIYIVSDFAEYNSSNLSSKFYQNVIINYEDKEITCDNFDINMQTNIAIAYNNVVVTDPKSVMKAGKIILDIETKAIDINPGNKKSKIKVKIN